MASLSRAEEVVLAAKKVMKRRNQEKAKEKRLKMIKWALGESRKRTDETAMLIEDIEAALEDES